MRYVAALFIILFLGAELYLSSAGSSHKKKKLLKGWNPVKGKITSIEKKFDQMLRKNVCELTIEAPEGRTVYAKDSALFCIYEEGEEVDLMEKNGVHRFRGNDRVDQRGKKELLWGVVPVMILVAVSAVIAILF